MAKPRLHLDADTSRKDLYKALRDRGHDITRTPAANLPPGASDEIQLLWATAQQRVLFTFNAADFLQLARKMPEHQGILLASQRSHSLGELVLLLDRVFNETEAEEWKGQVRWLSEWRKL